MASFLAQATSNSKVQLAATAVVSGAVVAAAILGFQRLQQEERLSRLKKSIPDPDGNDNALQKLPIIGTVPKPDKDDLRNEALARRAQAGDFDDELITEQLARNRVFLTPEGLDRLRAAFVVVVGCGGVGSHCVAALARSGVSRIRLIDFDQVTLSSLNRHAVATLADVGLPKVLCLRRRLLAVAPWVAFDLRVEKFDEASAGALLGPWVGGPAAGQKPDFVVDAIDNIDSKVELLRYCWEHQIPVIASMGAGCKSDPTRVRVGDVGASTDDRLSRATRRRLKLLGITAGIPVVYSTEKGGDGKAELLPLPEEEFQKGSVGDLGVLPDFRVRILPVLGTMPAVFGYTIANHIILSIPGYPMDYIPVVPKSKTYDGIQAAIQGAEEKIVRMSSGGSPEITIGLKVPISVGDIAFLVEEVYRGRSAISGLYNRLTLTRWRKPEGSTVIRIGDGSNEQKSTNVKLRHLVCMTREEALRHEQEVIKGDKNPEDVYEKEVVDRVEERLKEAEAFEKYR